MQQNITKMVGSKNLRSLETSQLIKYLENFIRNNLFYSCCINKGHFSAMNQLIFHLYLYHCLAGHNVDLWSNGR